jgi:predicted  nucleic acid-binding Zn-ribbon protein
MKSSNKTKKAVAGGALILAGFGAGAVVATTGSASADTEATSSAVSPATDKADPGKGGCSDEDLLTGTTASKVKDAVLAKYPKATIHRMETDSDGAYEARIVTADGKRVIVHVGKDFSVTGTESGRGPGGGPHGREHAKHGSDQDGFEQKGSEG